MCYTLLVKIIVKYMSNQFTMKGYFVITIITISNIVNNMPIENKSRNTDNHKTKNH